jgi:uncharacterized membrane protein
MSLKEKNMFKNTKELVFLSMFSAIILMLSIIPNLGFILLFPGISITIIHIPVLVGVMIVSRKQSLILGLMFGIGSLTAALMRASTPIELAFINPLISVLPRLLFAWFAYEIFHFLSFLSNKVSPYLSIWFVRIILGFGLYLLGNYLTTLIAISPIFIWIGVFLLYIVLVLITIRYARKDKNQAYIASTALIATLVHTLLVLTALVLVRPEFFNTTFGGAVDIIYSIMATNGVLEAIAATIIVTPIVITLKEIIQ